MEIGLVLPHATPTASPEFIRDFAQAAEDTHIDGVWAVDHLVLPRHTDSRYPLGREPVHVADGWLADNLAPNYEMLTTLSWIAAHTKTIRLGTSVAVLPIRNAVTNARQLATLDVLSGGRLTVGVGFGWLREEAATLGMAWEDRFRRSEEHIALLRALWCGPGAEVEFHGRFHDVPPMDRRPQPIQRPIPILVGGHSNAALDRAARLGDGWIAAPMSPVRLRERRDVLHAAAVRYGRDPTSLRIVASTTTSPTLALSEVLATYRDIGLHHLQVLLPTHDPARTITCIARLADARREVGLV